MESVTVKDIITALDSLALPGTVIVHSRVHTIGQVAQYHVDDIPLAYFHAFRDLGSKTIVVPTYTTSFGRHGTPFILEETPSETGVFSEFIRNWYGAKRSLHPIQSVAAIGPEAKALTANHPTWNVGHDTIWDRLLKADAWAVCIGIPPRLCLTFAHQVEYLACVPYRYNKILRGEVYAQSKKVDKDFFMSVRYLNLNTATDLTQFEQDLTDMGRVRYVPLGGSGIWAVRLKDVFEVGMRGLKDDPYYLLKEPPKFVPGEIPMDGITESRYDQPASNLLGV